MPCTSTASKKAKGRRLQTWVCKKLLATEGYGTRLHPDDIISRGMGQNGVDVIISRRGRELFPFAVECKNVEKLNIVGVFNEHYEKYKDKKEIVMLVHSRNKQEPLVTLKFEDFLNIWTNDRRENKE